MPRKIKKVAHIDLWVAFFEIEIFAIICSNGNLIGNVILS